jgi:hypothetical protein
MWSKTLSPPLPSGYGSHLQRSTKAVGEANGDWLRPWTTVASTNAPPSIPPQFFFQGIVSRSAQYGPPPPRGTFGLGTYCLSFCFGWLSLPGLRPIHEFQAGGFGCVLRLQGGTTFYAG